NCFTSGSGNPLCVPTESNQTLKDASLFVHFQPQTAIGNKQVKRPLFFVHLACDSRNGDDVFASGNPTQPGVHTSMTLHQQNLVSILADNQRISYPVCLNGLHEFVIVETITDIVPVFYGDLPWVNVKQFPTLDCNFFCRCHDVIPFLVVG